MVMSVSGPDAPAIFPSDGETGTLEFGWITVPESPSELSYTVSVPADTVGIQYINSEVKYRRSGGEIIEPVQPDPLVFKVCECDLNDDGDVDGSDLALSIDLGIFDIDIFAEDFGRTDCLE